MTNRSGIKAARRRAGLSAYATAEMCGNTTEARIFALERGRYRPRYDEAHALALVLGEPVETLFPGGIQPEGGRNE